MPRGALRATGDSPPQLPQTGMNTFRNLYPMAIVHSGDDGDD